MVQFAVSGRIVSETCRALRVSCNGLRQCWILLRQRGWRKKEAHPPTFKFGALKKSKELRDGRLASPSYRLMSFLTEKESRLPSVFSSRRGRGLSVSRQRGSSQQYPSSLLSHTTFPQSPVKKLFHPDNSNLNLFKGAH